MIVVRYVMDLYCDGAEGCAERDCHPVAGGLAVPLQVTGENRTECTAKAKKRGWKLDHRSDRALCPACAKAVK